MSDGAIVDESDIRTKLISTLYSFVAEYEGPPQSTEILFEPYHQAWGIYHSARQMSEDDAPGDYEVNNAEVGDIFSESQGLDRDLLVGKLGEVGKSLYMTLPSSIRPKQFGINLDYDRIHTFCDE